MDINHLPPTEVVTLAHVVACSYCGHSIVLGHTDPSTLVDYPVYNFDGSLDYIEVAHKSCDTRQKDIAAFDIWRRS
jgi:hypothetical protein